MADAAAKPAEKPTDDAMDGDIRSNGPSEASVGMSSADLQHASCFVAIAALSRVRHLLFTRLAGV